VSTTAAAAAGTGGALSAVAALGPALGRRSSPPAYEGMVQLLGLGAVSSAETTRSSSAGGSLAMPIAIGGGAVSMGKGKEEWKPGTLGVSLPLTLSCSRVRVPVLACTSAGLLHKWANWAVG
jgi:hypothetical protein